MKKLLFILLFITASWGISTQQWEFDYSNGESYIFYEKGIL